MVSKCSLYRYISSYYVVSKCYLYPWPQYWQPAATCFITDRYIFKSVKVKVKVTLVQALKLCTGRTAHRKSRGIALPFLDHGTRRGWRVSLTPRPLFTPGKDPVPIVLEVGWAPGPVWTGAENLTHTGILFRTVQPVASRYTDCATRPTLKVYSTAIWRYYSISDISSEATYLYTHGNDSRSEKNVCSKYMHLLHNIQ
jgi:hypothetical protein